MAEQPSYKNLEQFARALEPTDATPATQAIVEKLFNLSLDMLCVADFEGYFRIVNAAFQNTLGHSRAALLKTPFIEFVHPDDRAATLAAMKQLASGETVRYFENRYRCKDGSYKWLAWTSVPVTEERFEYAVARDITEQKAMQQKLATQHELLRKSEARLQALFDAAAEFIFVIDRDGTIIKANRYFCEHSGYDIDEVIGRSFKDFLTGESRHVCDCEFPVLVEQGHHRSDLEFVCKEGGVIDMECSAAAVPDEYGNSTTFLMILRDMTERRRAAVALAYSERRFRAIFNATFQFTGLLNPEGILLEANQTVLDFLGYTESDLVGKPFWEVMWRDVPPEEQERIKASIREAAHGKLVRFQTDMVGKDNVTRTVDVSLKPILNDEGDTVLIIPEGRDITELKHAEKKLWRHQQDMAHVMRLSTMGEMASGIAHELNQPLAALVAYCGAATGMAKSFPDAPQELSDVLRRASEQAYRAGEIIRHLREFVGKDSDQLALIDLDRVIEDLKALLNWDLVSAHVNLELQLDGRGRKVRANKVQIEQVLINLVRNSVDAIQSEHRNGGKVTVKTRLRREEAIEVTVTDNGPGIEPDMMEKLFLPFQTNKASGMGMGLPISETIIEAHGGRLWVDKNYRNGALFVFTLPVV